MVGAKPDSQELLHDALCGPRVVLRGGLEDPLDAVGVLWDGVARAREFSLVDALLGDGKQFAVEPLVRLEGLGDECSDDRCQETWDQTHNFCTYDRLLDEAQCRLQELLVLGQFHAEERHSMIEHNHLRDHWIYWRVLGPIYFRVVCKQLGEAILIEECERWQDLWNVVRQQGAHRTNDTKSLNLPIVKPVESMHGVVRLQHLLRCRSEAQGCLGCAVEFLDLLWIGDKDIAVVRRKELERLASRL